MYYLYSHFCNHCNYVSGKSQTTTRYALKDFVLILLSWWCHFDDDNYVNVLRLGEVLAKHSPSESVYLGKPSTARPMKIHHPFVRASQNDQVCYTNTSYSFSLFSGDPLLINLS